MSEAPKPLGDKDLAQTRRAVAHAVESGGIMACSLEWALTFQDLLATLDAMTERAEKAEQMFAEEVIPLITALYALTNSGELSDYCVEVLTPHMAKCAGVEATDE